MSHIIHFWEGPTPVAADEAAELVAGGGQGLTPSARFPAFAAALKKKYPDAHALESKGKDADKAVWTDSPLTGETASPFLVLGIKVDALDRKLVHFVVKTAGEHGLHAYDMQTGELWRKDDDPPPAKRVRLERLPKPTQPIMSLYRFARVASWDPLAVPGRPEPASDERMELTVEEANRAVFDPIAAHLGRRGWGKGTGLGRSLLHRTVGPARQVLRFPVDDSGQRPLDQVDHYVLDVAFEFEIPAVQERLFELHPKWIAKRKRARSKERDAHADAHCAIHELFGTAGYEALRFQPTGYSVFLRLRFRRDMEWWPAVFDAWYASQAAPLLDACTDLVTLNRLLNNPYRVWNGMQRDEWELMSSLALASLAPHEEVPWANVAHTARYRADKMALDEGLIERTIAALAPATGGE